MPTKQPVKKSEISSLDIDYGLFGAGLCAIIVIVLLLFMVNTIYQHQDTRFQLHNFMTTMGSGGLATGEPAPEFVLPALHGDRVHLTEQRGQVVLVDFWATWCGPCKAELPHIEQIHQDYRTQGLRVLAISTDTDPELVAPYIKENGYTFPVLYADKTIEKKYKVMGIPVVYLIDRQGRVRFHHLGYTPGQEYDLSREIEELLAEEGGDIPTKSPARTASEEKSGSSR